MGYVVVPGRTASIKLAAIVVVALLGIVLASLCLTGTASAASLVGKDGRIHACYKVKGKAKGTLRVVRSAKARCPRHWKKVAWNARGQSGFSGGEGFSGEQGSGGESGQGGAKGDTGAQGTAAKVSSLESKVTQLLGQVKSLESILGGINNAQLKEAIGAVPVVQTLCSQAGKLNEQSTKLGESMQALNGVLGPLVIAFVPVSVPTALPAFACPAL
jgi:hypothetical protein